MRVFYGLGAYEPASWESFLAARGGTYDDGDAACVKDKSNRPVCRRRAEATPAARAGGAVAALQRATDRLINAVPAYQAAEVTLVGGEKLLAALESDPIRRRSGYDGLLGPSTHGWVNGAFVLASAVAEVPADVAQAVFAPNEAVFVNLAAPLAAFFNSVADNLDSLLEAYKRAPRAVPQLSPETIRVVEEIITKRKQRLIGVGAVIAAGAAVPAAVAVVGLAKAAGAAKAAAALMGVFGIRPRRARRRRRR